MTKSNEKYAEFERVVRPLIKYMAENHHPHTKIIVEATGAELVEGVMNFPTTEYLKD